MAEFLPHGKKLVLVCDCVFLHSMCHSRGSMQLLGCVCCSVSAEPPYAQAHARRFALKTAEEEWLSFTGMNCRASELRCQPLGISSYEKKKKTQTVSKQHKSFNTSQPWKRNLPCFGKVMCFGGVPSISLPVALLF